MTPFCFEHVFTAPSPDAVLAAYFDADLQAEQDRAIDVSERDVLELVDDGAQVYRVTRVVPRRQLPPLLATLAGGPLHYIEIARWKRSTSEIDIEIRPSLMGGRARVTATYRLDVVAPGIVRRRYAGHVSVNVTLLASRVERGIVAEFERSMPLAATCTQAWLDRQSVTSVTPQA